MSVGFLTEDQMRLAMEAQVGFARATGKRPCLLPRKDPDEIG